VLASLPTPKGNNFFSSLFLKKKVSFSCVALFRGERGGNISFFLRAKERGNLRYSNSFFFGVEKRVKKKVFPLSRHRKVLFFKSLSKTLLRGRRARILCTRKQNLHFWSFKFRENGKKIFFRRRLLNFFFLIHV